MSATPGTIEHVGPPLGAHNREVYGRLGISAGELGALEEAGVV
jgi:crotonobetainyl-CoA:carnitine CoA-transferase CaiB-like acyl-CoA transferase